MRLVWRTEGEKRGRRSREKGTRSPERAARQANKGAYVVIVATDHVAVGDILAGAVQRLVGH